MATKSVWTGFGGLCEARNSGDTVVRYDQLAGRWLPNQDRVLPFAQLQGQALIKLELTEKRLPLLMGEQRQATASLLAVRYDVRNPYITHHRNDNRYSGQSAVVLDRAFSGTRE